MSTLTYPAPRRVPLLPQVLAALVAGSVLFLGVVIVWTLGYQLVYAGRIFPGVSVAGINLSGLSPREAAVKLNQALSYPIGGKLLFRDGERVWVAAPVELGMVFDPSASAQAAYRLGRSGGLFGALRGQIRARGYGVDVPPVILFDQRVAYQYLQGLAEQIDQPPVEASIRLDGTTVVAVPGQVGRTLNLDATLVYLGAQLQTFRDGEVQLVIQQAAPSVMDVSAQADVARAILSQPLTLVVPNFREGDPGPWVYDVPVLANMIGIQRVESGGQTQVQVALQKGALQEALGPIAQLVDQSPANARFYFDDPTGQLVLVSSAQVGRKTDIEASVKAINEALLRGEHTVPLVVAETQPEVTDSATGAQLGITEKIIEYTSYFYGSSSARIQNIQAAAAQFHGVLIAPGEEFSMGSVMGDVSLDNGFAEALIIYGGRTIKGVGGGVCQVSTTLFRTVFLAGFPVNERHQHAYRVSYYERTAGGSVDPNWAGLDATVYFPLVDFKFTNDTPYWLLMETYVYPGSYSLTWKFYSTKDGRSVDWHTTGPQNVVPAPKPLFEENPDLNKNQIEQVDYAARGADVTVTRTVWKDGAIYFQDTFQTHYEPWQAICQYGPKTEEPEKIAKRQGKCQSPGF